MRIVLSTWGTTGDVYPFFALSKRLLKAGHQVGVCTSEIYREHFTKIGVDFYGVGIPFKADDFHRMMDTIVRIRNPLKSTTLIAKEGLLAGANRWYQDCVTAMKGYDLAVCHSADIPGQEAAIRNHLAWITVSYCPGFIKTVSEAPHPMPNLGVSLNTLLWGIVEWLIRRQVDPMFNDFLTDIGGQKRELIGLEGMYSPELNLIAASPHINKPPPDLPQQHKFTGVWFLEEEDYHPPTVLEEFLAQGSPPIIVTFGSMGGTEGIKTTEILIEAVERAGRRAIIQSGWGELGTDRSAYADMFFVDYVPHGFLFRQGCCIIHHGGAGTTASACRAGVPSIVVPHLGDQSYWGKTLQRLGVAPKILHRQDMTAKRLMTRVNAVISSTRMAETAKSLARRIDTEDGLGMAVKLIEEFAREKGIH